MACRKQRIFLFTSLVLVAAISDTARADWWPAEQQAPPTPQQARTPFRHPTTGVPAFTGVTAQPAAAWATPANYSVDAGTQSVVATAPAMEYQPQSYVSQLPTVPTVPAPEYGYMRLRAGADFLFLSREPASDSLFIFDSSGRTVSHSDLEFDAKFALRYRLEYVDNQGIGFDLSFFDLDEFSTQQVESGPDVTPIFFNGVPVDTEPSYTADYLSTLRSGDANAWLFARRRGRIGIGIRNTQLNETFNVTVTGSSPQAGFFSRTTNDLWGGQLMAQLFQPLSPSMRFESKIGVGAYNNRISVDAQALGIEIDERKNVLSYGANFTVGVSLQTTRHCNIRAGYEGLLLDNVALAPDQSASQSFVAPTNDFVTDRFYASGLYVGSLISF